jgi:hypothetical protein
MLACGVQDEPDLFSESESRNQYFGNTRHVDRIALRSRAEEKDHSVRQGYLALAGFSMSSLRGSASGFGRTPKRAETALSTRIQCHCGHP